MAKFKKDWRFYVFFFAFAFINPLVYAQSTITLHDSLNAALEKQSRSVFNEPIESSNNDGFSAWIDGAPSVSLMRLQSDETLGTTESEVSLNFAIKSPFLKEVEKQLESKIAEVRTSAEQQYALYLSGLIRELLWELKIEETIFEATSRKRQLLSKLAAKFKEMADAQAIPQYLSLIVQNELNQLAISSQENQKRIEDLHEKYFRITGLRAVPVQIEEAPLDSRQLNLKFHPDIRALDAAYESSKQQLASTGKQANSWNVNLIGKRVSSNSFSENQLGVGIEIPISLGSNLSNIQQSEYVRLTAEYEVSRRKLLTQLSETQIAMMREYEFLKQKQRLLNNSEITLNSLNQAMNELIEANAPNQEFYIRTLLNNIDSEKNVEVNLILTQRQIALIRQAAGVSL